MSNAANQLSPEKAERLAMLAEECGEVIQAIGKILRHGYESHRPGNPLINNRISLQGELTDLQAVLVMMECNGDIVSPSPMDVSHAVTRKMRWAHHQGMRPSAPLKPSKK